MNNFFIYTMQKEVQDFFEKFIHAMEQRTLKPAFDSLEKLVGQVHDWRLQEQLGIAKRTYKTMLYYWIENKQDIERETIYQTLLCSLYRVADEALWKIKLINEHSFNNMESSEELFFSYKELTKRINLSDFVSAEEKRVFEREKENIHKKIFKKILLSDHWTNKEKTQWINLIFSPNEKILACLAISAVTLNLLETFDEEKINFLLEISRTKKCIEESERALVGVVLIIRKYNYRLHLYKKIIEQFYELIEIPTITKTIRQILLQFIACKETEQITRKITDKLLPEIMQKMKSNISPSFKVLNSPVEDKDIEDKDPEWRYLIESSDMEEKLKEISEWQREGVDVMHSSFIHLKNYPFFKEISHWFIPFTALSEMNWNSELAPLVELLKASSFLCHSDKYSLYLNVSQMPESLRNKIIRQFSSELDALKEATGETNYSSLNISCHIRQYIQDLYRFYKLYPNKKEFEDIFDIKPELYQVPWIFFFIKEEENLSVIGEYYFYKNCFDEAIDIYDQLLQTDPNNDVIYQKKGFSLQMKGKFQMALESYQRAELINPNHSWTIKKIAYLHRILKNPREALYYYKKAEQLNPENLSVSLSIGHCYSELEMFEQALKYYFKVEYLTEEKEKIWRLIGWCSFLKKNYSQATHYFNKLMQEGKPNTTDFLNLGHVQWLNGNAKEAIRLYRLIIEKSNFSYDDFSKFFYNDVPVLIQVGMSMEAISFMIDSCYFL